jgi:hypothetical protein
MILIILLIIIVIIVLWMKYNKTENFMLLTVDPVHFIPSEWMNSAPRHVRLSRAGGIMYVSNTPPSESCCENVQCPYFIDKLTTLGDNNYCWKC